MLIIEGIGFVAAVIAIFNAGYYLGKARVRKQKNELVVDKFLQIKNSVKILRLDCNPKQGARGQTLEITFEISSKVDFSFDAWFGASLLTSDEKEFYDIRQDKTMTLEPGTQLYKRDLSIPRSAEKGVFKLKGALYIGRRSHPGESIRLDRKGLADNITII